MVKNGSIIPLCFIALSGCSIFDNVEMRRETPLVSGPIIEDVAPAAPANALSPASSAPAVTQSRSLTTEDIRRLQTRLRDLGFYPGAVDGVPGGKTKAAFGRLENGCAKLKPLNENLPEAVIDGFTRPGAKAPSSADILILQSQLRSAGFDPGPVDGIAGARTKALVAVLHSSCSMAKEFQGALDVRVRAVNMDKPVSAAAESPKASVAVPRGESAKQAGSVPAAGQDDIRILQLRLRDAGFDPGPFDGIMGAKTKAALEQYEANQRNRKIKVSLTTTKISGHY